MLVVQPSGKLSWVIFYRRLSDRKQRKLTLGGFPSVATAHKVTQAALDAVAEGKDPATDKLEARRLATCAIPDGDLFRSVAERYLREYASKRRNYPEKARHLGRRLRDDERRVIDGRAVSLWGEKRIQEITRRDVREHLEKLAETAPIGANRTYSELRKFFNWCVGKDILASSPITGLQPPSEENVSRKRVLIRRAEIPGSTDDELRWLWQAASAYERSEDGEAKGGIGKKHRGPYGPMVQMLILSGQRRTEVAAMEWRELDLEAARGRSPASRTKNAQAHIVPLSDAIVAVLDSLPRVKNAAHVFTTDGENPVSGFSRMKNRIDKLMGEIAEEERGEEVAIPAWTLHDIRRTVAAGMQRLGVRMEVTEKVLNHVSGSFGGIAGVYQVHDYASEKAAALQQRGRFVMNEVRKEPTSNVVPLHATGRES